MRLLIIACVFLVSLSLLPATAGLSLKGPDAGTLTGKATASDAEKALKDAEKEINDAEITVSEDANTTQSASSSAEGSTQEQLDAAKTYLKNARHAWNLTKYNESLEAAQQARDQAVKVQKDAAARKANATRVQVQSLEKTHDRLTTVTDTLEGQNISMDATRHALDRSIDHITTAENLLTVADGHLAEDNVTAARAHIHAAAAEYREARQILHDAPLRTEIQSGISAKIDNIASMKSRTQASVNRAQNTFGTKKQTKQARKDYDEAEQSYEEAQNSQNSVSSASSLEEMAASAHRAASTLDETENRLQSAQQNAEAARSMFFRNSALGATLLAVMGGGGFLYYRMHGRKKPREKLSAAKKAAAAETDES